MRRSAGRSPASKGSGRPIGNGEWTRGDHPRARPEELAPLIRVSLATRRIKRNTDGRVEVSPPTTSRRCSRRQLMFRVVLVAEREQDRAGAQSWPSAAPHHRRRSAREPARAQGHQRVAPAPASNARWRRMAALTNEPKRRGRIVADEKDGQVLLHRQTPPRVRRLVFCRFFGGMAGCGSDGDSAREPSHE